MKTKLVVLLQILLSLCVVDVGAAFSPLGTAISYQGRLMGASGPANGNYDFTFALQDAATGGAPITTVTNLNVAVSNGLFTTSIDFGSGIFIGYALWVEIGVRSNTVPGSFATLSPRQPLAAAPNAQFAALAATVPGGSIGPTQLGANSVSSFAIQNNAVTSLAIADGTIAPADLNLAAFGTTFWSVSGNSGTTAGPNFLGTKDNQPLEIQAGGVRALRIEPNGSAGANLIGGYFQNSASGAQSATVAGGGTSGSPNYAMGNYAFIGAGHGARAGAFSAVVDGAYNDNSSSLFSFIGAGLSNTNGADYSFIGSGTNNAVLSSAPGSFIGGGFDNKINFGTVGTIGGGFSNTVQSFGDTVSGGQNNMTSSSYSTVGGGYFNQALDLYATIPGGANNLALGFYSFAAGQQAQALHQGTFVWADSQNATFASTTNDQFNVRAANGLRVSEGGTNGNVVIQLLGGTLGVGYQAINFNGYYDQVASAERRFSAAKTRWRMVVDQRTTSDLMTIDNFNGTTVSTFVAVLTNGNVGIGITSPTNKLHVAGGVSATAFISTSDRNAKENFAPVSSRDVLDKVASLPIATWNFKELHDGRHMGPMAQDFYAAFHLGGSDTTITTVDPDGVALAAIQGLNQKVEAGSQRSEDRIQRLEAENAELKGRLERLERMIESKGSERN
jgi:hypothetical protein